MWIALGPSIFIDLYGLVNRLRLMFYFGKSLEAAALAVTALALLVGFKENSMTKELTMLSIGVVLFLIGRLLESIAAKR